jgi:hypothetical protein
MNGTAIFFGAFGLAFVVGALIQCILILRYKKCTAETEGRVTEVENWDWTRGGPSKVTIHYSVGGVSYHYTGYAPPSIFNHMPSGKTRKYKVFPDVKERIIPMVYDPDNPAKNCNPVIPSNHYTTFMWVCLGIAAVLFIFAVIAVTATS